MTPLSRARRLAKPDTYGEALADLMAGTRFWARVNKDSLGGCWAWTGTKLPNGYGQIYVFGRHRVAHRVSWEHVNGPVPPGLELDHLCRVRACVNPVHLEAVTGAENRRRGQGLATLNARKTECKSGHPFDEKNTRRRTDGDRECRRCQADASKAYRAKKARERSLALDGYPARWPTPVRMDNRFRPLWPRPSTTRNTRG